MTWPAEAAATDHLDSTDDDPSQAVAELKSAVDKLNAIIAHAGGTGKSMLAAATRQAGREVLDVGFPTGTKMLFQQTVAPTGWTKDTAHDNKALRIVNGTAGSGGSISFTTAFASRAIAGSVGNTTLTSAQMPSHSHSVYGGWKAIDDNYYKLQDNLAVAGINAATDAREAARGGLLTWDGGGASHNHSFTGTNINMAVQYVDVIVASKD